MKTTTKWLLIAVLGWCVGASSTSMGQVPELVNYQGRLTDTGGSPLPDGEYDILFRIWDDPSSTSPANVVWAREFASIRVVGGRFGMILSDAAGTLVGTPQTPTLTEAFEDSERYMALTITRTPIGPVSIPVEILPRQSILTVPYALKAMDSETSNKSGGIDLGASDYSTYLGVIGTPQTYNAVASGGWMNYDLLDGGANRIEATITHPLGSGNSPAIISGTIHGISHNGCCGTIVRIVRRLNGAGETSVVQTNLANATGVTVETSVSLSWIDSLTTPGDYTYSFTLEPQGGGTSVQVRGGAQISALRLPLTLP